MAPACSGRVREDGSPLLDNTVAVWVVFNLFVLVMLAIDLGVFHKRSHEVKIKEALTWSAVWIGLALLFNLFVWWWRGSTVALQFLTGYLIEKSLSVDNIFVFLLVFTYFRVPSKYQHKVLFWGIIGALVMRAVLIFAGVTLIERFHWIIYVFGVFLIYTGIKMVTTKDKELDPEKNIIYRGFRKLLKTTPHYVEDRFFVMQDGHKHATPLLLVLIFVETTDLLFALDSIPAILAITRDPFIVYTSNVFAILGLRALYFAVAGLMQLFHYLHYGLSGILVFVGVKMLIAEYYKVPVGLALGVIAMFLVVSIVMSLRHPLPKDPLPEPVDPIEHEPGEPFASLPQQPGD